MKTIYVESVVHKNEKRIKLVFKFDPELVIKIKKLPGARWSQTLFCWHIPYDKEVYWLLKSLKGVTIITKKKDGGNQSSVSHQKEDNKLMPEVQKRIIEYGNYMRTLRYARQTIRTYESCLVKFFCYHNTRSPEEIDQQDIIDFNHEFIINNRLSFSYQNQLINALKGFYRMVYNRNLNMEEVERPRKRRPLPKVLSIENVREIIQSIDNIKHRAIVSLIYSAGLRRSELLNLKWQDIDMNRGLIIVKNAKGNKDRIVPLASNIVPLLKSYWGNRELSGYMFRGPDGGKYGSTSIHKIFQRAKAKAGIDMKCGVHVLRHSYATHLHERGVDIRVIQELLGHNSTRTTEIYTHVSSKTIRNIKSPFDDLEI